MPDQIESNRLRVKLKVKKNREAEMFWRWFFSLFLAVEVSKESIKRSVINDYLESSGKRTHATRNVLMSSRRADSVSSVIAQRHSIKYDTNKFLEY